MKKIEKSVVINTSKEKLWEVLTLDTYTSDWYSIFSPGSHAVTDWKEGSAAHFIDQSNNGMAARIRESIPGKSLVIEFAGQVINGKEDLESPEALKYKGGLETYRLVEENGKVRLDISSDMDEGMFEEMSGLWEKALERLKQLAEH